MRGTELSLHTHSYASILQCVDNVLRVLHPMAPAVLTRHQPCQPRTTVTERFRKSISRALHANPNNFPDTVMQVKRPWRCWRELDTYWNSVHRTSQISRSGSATRRWSRRVADDLNELTIGQTLATHALAKALPFFTGPTSIPRAPPGTAYAHAQWG